MIERLEHSEGAGEQPCKCGMVRMGCGYYEEGEYWSRKETGVGALKCLMHACKWGLMEPGG